MSCKLTLAKLKDIFENKPWYVRWFRKFKKFFITGLDDDVWYNIREKNTSTESILDAIRARRKKI